MNAKAIKTLKRIQEANMAKIIWADNIKRVCVAENKALQEVIQGHKETRRVA